MVGVSTTTSAYILKTLWPQTRVQNLVYKDHPFLAMVSKMTSFTGANLVLAVRHSDTQGRSAVFATAQANKGAHAGKAFTLTRVKDYQVVSLETEAILAAKDDKGALIRNLDTEIQSGMNNIGKSLATKLHRNGSGKIGARSGALSGDVLTLTNINDITNFEVGMRLVAAETETGAIRGGTAAVVDAVDRDRGTITSTTWGNITTFTASDSLFAEGDAQNNGAAVAISGLDAWFPASAPSATAFFGVDRTADVVRLAGHRIDVSDLNPEEGLITALSKVGRDGGSPGHFFVNHLDYRNIEISLGSKVQTEYMEVAGVGFTALRVTSPKGICRVVADQDRESGKGKLLQMDTLKLYSLGEAPMVLDMDGDRLSREASSDGWEARIAYYAQLGCDAPGFNAHVVLPS